MLRVKHASYIFTLNYLQNPLQICIKITVKFVLNLQMEAF